jgi:hypothetical protein
MFCIGELIRVNISRFEFFLFKRTSSLLKGGLRLEPLRENVIMPPYKVFNLGIMFVLYSFTLPLKAETTNCVLERYEDGLESKKVFETKLCPVPCEEDAKLEGFEVSENCIMTHESSTTEIKVAYEENEQNRVIVMLNNMNKNNPVTWKSEIQINKEPKNLVNVGLEKVTVHCDR